MSNGSGTTNPVRDFLLGEYTAKVGIVTGQYDRILTRFNYFLSIEIALVGAFGFLVVQKSASGLFLLIVAGSLSAWLWLFTSLADRRLVLAYRNDATVAYVLVLRDLLKSGGSDTAIAGPLQMAVDHYVNGLKNPEQKRSLTDDAIGQDLIPVAAGDTQNRADLAGGRFSVTRMPTWASAGCIVFWIGCLIFFWNRIF